MRNPKSFRAVVHVFCEGATEYNYFEEYRKSSHLKISLKMIDVKGGGYQKMVDGLSKSLPIGIMARVVLVDLDRYFTAPGERAAFKRLVQYIQNENKKNLPTFLIVSNPDFDDFILLHDAQYHFTNKAEILKRHKYLSIGDLKNDKTVYQKFNKSPCSLANAINALSDKGLITNAFVFRKKDFSLSNSLKIDWSKEGVQTSNIKDFFNLINDLVSAII